MPSRLERIIIYSGSAEKMGLLLCPINTHEKDEKFIPVSTADSMFNTSDDSSHCA